jgi:hypothetical protein
VNGTAAILLFHLRPAGPPLGLCATRPSPPPGGAGQANPAAKSSASGCPSPEASVAVLPGVARCALAP